MAKVHLFRASFAANNACEVLGFGNIGIAVSNFFDGIAHDNLEDVNCAGVHANRLRQNMKQIHHDTTIGTHLGRNDGSVHTLQSHLATNRQDANC